MPLSVKMINKFLCEILESDERDKSRYMLWYVVYCIRRREKKRRGRRCIPRTIKSSSSPHQKKEEIKNNKYINI